MVQDTHENFFYGSTFPDLVIWNATAHAKYKEVVALHACVCGYHAAAVDKLIACKREPNNAVGTYCGSKDRRFIEH